MNFHTRTKQRSEQKFLQRPMLIRNKHYGQLIQLQPHSHLDQYGSTQSGLIMDDAPFFHKEYILHLFIY